MPVGSSGAAAALADVRFTPYWSDQPGPEPASALVGPTAADLAVVGAGYTGLWTALLAKERDPARDVLLLEARTSGWAASGRNGGFCSASLTHGLRNGLDRYPDELPTLHRLGMANLDEIEAAVTTYGLDCSFERTGELTVATAGWQADGLRELATLGRDLGADLVWLDAEAVRELVDSPTYVGGLLDRRGTAMLDPARLVVALRAACLRAGVRIHEQTPVTRLEAHGSDVGLQTPYGRVSARRVALGTGAARPLLRRLGSYIAPVWDYALVSEPLSPEQRESIAWKDRVGVSDAGNQFHYYRLTDDDRILWGGYDAVYRLGGGRDERFARDPATFLRLAEHFFDTFPQLDGLRFTHAWGGVIDTCSRFSAFWGTAMGGRVAYALGYTGLGVGATRFGAQVVLDLLAGEQTERTSLRMVRTKPLPFPPEPARWAGIQLTRRALARADRRDGRRGPWLRTLDRLGLGFDS